MAPYSVRTLGENMSSKDHYVQSELQKEPSRTSPITPKDQKGWSGFVFLAITALAFGSAPTFAKVAFDSGVNPISLQIFRFSITFFCILTATLVINQLQKIRLEDLIRLLALALATAISSFCYMTAVDYVSVAVASLTFFTFPLIVGALSHFLGWDLLTPKRLSAMIVAFLGLCLVLGGDLSLDWKGVLMAFTAGTAVAISFIISKPLTQNLSALTITCWATGLPCLIYLVMGLILGELSTPGTAKGAAGVFGNSICYAIGLACLYASIARLGAIRTAIFINVEPLISVAAAFLILGQSIGSFQILGAFIVVGGILLITIDQSEHRNSP